MSDPLNPTQTLESQLESGILVKILNLSVILHMIFVGVEVPIDYYHILWDGSLKDCMQS